MSTACGGIVVGKVTYHLGGIGKAYALLAGLIISAFMYPNAVTWRLLLAVPSLVLAFYLKFAFPAPVSWPHSKESQTSPKHWNKESMKKNE
mmetsp:Transcript_27275/g.37961  ORF Transcript_27275/g.37961 Transcript_27275/m.37961 type:complete len:91 (+) Transcript_27275:51-323(+)